MLFLIIFNQSTMSIKNCKSINVDSMDFETFYELLPDHIVKAFTIYKQSKTIYIISNFFNHYLLSIDYMAVKQLQIMPDAITITTDVGQISLMNNGYLISQFWSLLDNQ